VIRILAAGSGELRQSVEQACDNPHAMRIEAAVTAEAVIDKLAHDAVDCVIADKTVGSSNTLELYELVNANSATRQR
jgi:hypothetical protein